MLATLRSNWFAVRASYWFYPALFALSGLVLALILIRLDHAGAGDWLARAKWFVPARPEGASNILTVLAGSMIGVASTVFSITIAAVAYASGNHGPRLLTNFMEDKGNQLSLGTFIGTFVYAITVLRAVRADDEPAAVLVRSVQDQGAGFVPQLSLLAAFTLMIVSVGVLVYFLHHIPASIRINSVLENIGARLLREITEFYPEAGERDPPVRIVARGAPIRAERTGYIRLIEFGALLEAAKKHDLTLSLTVRPGDFVYPGIPLAITGADKLGEDAQRAVRETFAIGASRTPEMDLEFSIDELVEIALRALSPGINDAFTAIAATHWLGAATALLGGRNLDTENWNSLGQECPVAPAHSDFEHFLQRGFGSARSALATDRLTTMVALEALAQAAEQVAGAHRRHLIHQEIEALTAQAEENLRGPDIAEVRQAHAAVRARLAG